MIVITIHCQICAENCPIEDLRCQQGKEYEILSQSRHETSENKLFALFYKLSHLFIHRRGQDQGKNRILAILRHHGDMTQRELLDHTDIRSASLSELLAKIEANGDIHRERSRKNARNVNICLTEKGKAAAEQIHKENLFLSDELFSCLNNEEQVQLEHILIKLIINWKKEKKR